jgi:hypothetical protein
MNVITFEPKPGNKPDTSSALRLLDDLRIQIESGAVIAMIVTAIEPTDVTQCYVVASIPITRLRIMGAMAGTQWHFMNDQPP